MRQFLEIQFFIDSYGVHTAMELMIRLISSSVYNLVVPQPA